MNAAIVTALIRHLLTIAGGAVASRYSIDGASIEAIAGGAAALAGVIWSILEKKRR
jgi:hypothetical protein